MFIIYCSDILSITGWKISTFWDPLVGRPNLTFWNKMLDIQNSTKQFSLGNLPLCWNIEILARPKVNKIVWPIKLNDEWQPIVRYCFILSNILFLCKGQEIKEQFYSSLPACAG